MLSYGEIQIDFECAICGYAAYLTIKKDAETVECENCKYLNANPLFVENQFKDEQTELNFDSNNER